VVAALLAIAAPAHAYFEQTNVGARVVALGPSAMAMVNDVSAYHWNPGALATLRRGELLIDYSKPYGVENLGENAIVVGGRRWGTGLALAWHRLAVQDVYAEDQFCLAAGRTLVSTNGGHHLDAGATFKYGRAGFQPFDAPGAGRVDYGSLAKGSLDLGARWRTPWSVDFNWVMRDVIQPRYEFVLGSGGDHQNARQDLAAAFHWNRESTISVGWAQPSSGRSTLSAGMEILFFDVFAIRSGLRNLANAYEAQRSPNEVQFTGGFGVYHKGYFVDAAAETNRDLGASYRVSLRFPFGRGGAR
jgi:hypothetical protein